MGLGTRKNLRRSTKDRQHHVVLAIREAYPLLEEVVQAHKAKLKADTDLVKAVTTKVAEAKLSGSELVDLVKALGEPATRSGMFDTLHAHGVQELAQKASQTLQKEGL